MFLSVCWAFQQDNDKMIYIEIKDSTLFLNDGGKFKLHFEYITKDGERNNLKAEFNR
jgi:hypothetical protein